MSTEATREAFEKWWPSVGQTIGKEAAWQAWQAAQANQEAIVRAALEAAAKKADFYAENSGTAERIAEDIRNLKQNVQQILESVK